jgi:tRNA-Thr(GGU) m(6)t(6)A37 methyltransferase TsaA
LNHQEGPSKVGCEGPRPPSWFYAFVAIGTSIIVKQIKLSPIGHVRSPERLPRKGGFEEVVAEIVLNEDLVDGLKGLDDFSHIEVIYYMHLPPADGDARRAKMLVGNPMGLTELPEVGVFSLRSPHRPNRIGITLCELLSIKGNIIKVKGLDALDGSPVIDIKGPSRSYLELYPGMRFPRWTETLKQIKEEQAKGPTKW